MRIIEFVRFFKVCIVLVIIGFSSYCNGQNTETQVSRIQRSIYVYNLAQQVNWPNDLSGSFKIGVLGPDRTIIDFTSMSQKRDIQTLPVNVLKFLIVKNIKDVQVLYVNKKYNFQMPYILQSVKGKGVLVISEDYIFDAAMINIVRVGNTFRHQINENLLKEHGFSIAPSLKSYSIKTAEKWLAFFQEAQDSLRITQQQVISQDSLINKQAAELNDKTELLDTIQEVVRIKNSSIKELLSKEELQKKTIIEKKIIEQELEIRITDQTIKLIIQDSILKNREKEILLRQNSINNQQIAILDQENKLVKQSFELSLMENLNWILAVIALLLLIAGIIAYRSFRSKDKLFKQLIVKNATILYQSEELTRKNGDLEQFAYIASHDLQEPLNTISSFIGLIKNDYKDLFDDLGKQSIDFIEEASLRMKRLIKVLLEYSRIEKDRVFTQVDCNQLMIDLVKDVDSLIKHSHATIMFEDLPILSGSDIELRLLFQNLVTNALKFCPDNRPPILDINVIKTKNKSQLDKKVWQFAFKDNGIGIPKEHQERIFLIFQRLHTADEYAGTGIGLAHCKKIVSIHKGDIWLESEVNLGTTFYFTIPCD